MITDLKQTENLHFIIYYAV